MLIFIPVGFQIRQNKATIAIDTLDNCKRRTSKSPTSHVMFAIYTCEVWDFNGEL